MPTVLTKEEARKVLAALAPEYQLIGHLLYGTGMRLLECLRLRVKDIDFGRNLIVIHDGKGEKDLVTMLPEKTKTDLQRHLKRVKLIYQADLAAGHCNVYLPYALDRKYPNAAKEWCWQYVFPAPSLSIDPHSGKIRHHLHEMTVQRA